ncbi:MAG: hypothetical protein V3T83_16945 [Acidobacteriota bacterium]
MQNAWSRTRLALLLAAVLCAPAMAAELSADGQKVVDYLLKDWSKRMHSTSIPQAMENMAMAQDDGLRLEIGEHFRDNSRIAGNVRAWGANNYLLSDQEKRIAKYLINSFNADSKLPDLGQASKALNIPAGRLKQRLAFMARAGFLSGDSGTALGYKLTEKYMRWGGPLRFNYHTIKVGDEAPFGVW